MTSKAEAVETLDSYLRLTQQLRANDLRDQLAKFATKAVDAGVPHESHGTTRGTRITFFGSTGSAKGDLNSPGGFEIAGRRLNRNYLWSPPVPMRVTAVRILSAATMDKPNQHGSWYNPTPTNVQFANGKGLHRLDSENLWAVFEPAGEELVSTAQIIVPETPQADILRHIVSHLQAVVEFSGSPK